MSVIQDQLPQHHLRGERPEETLIRGRCPICHEPLVSICTYQEGRGYLLQWCCWASLEEEPRCQYRHVL